MMKWVLIYIVLTATHGSASVSQEFDDLDACEHAWTRINIELKALEERDPNLIKIATCTPKGVYQQPEE